MDIIVEPRMPEYYNHEAYITIVCKESERVAIESLRADIESLIKRRREHESTTRSNRLS